MAFVEMNHKLVIFRCNKVRYNVKHNACVLFCGDHLSLASIWEVQQLPSLPLLGFAFGSQFLIPFFRWTLYGRGDQIIKGKSINCYE